MHGSLRLKYKVSFFFGKVRVAYSVFLWLFTDPGAVLIWIDGVGVGIFGIFINNLIVTMGIEWNGLSFLPFISFSILYTVGR